MANTVILADGLSYTFYDNYAEALGAMLSHLTGAGFLHVSSDEYHKNFVKENSELAQDVRSKLDNYLDKIHWIWDAYRDIEMRYWRETKDDYISEEARRTSYKELVELLSIDVPGEIKGLVSYYMKDAETLYHMLITGYIVQASAANPGLINTLLTLLGGDKVNPADAKIIAYIQTEVAKLIFNIPNLCVMDYLDKKAILEDGMPSEERRILVFDKLTPISHVRRRIKWYDEFEKAKVTESINNLCNMIERSKITDKEVRVKALRSATNKIATQGTQFKKAFKSGTKR